MEMPEKRIKVNVEDIEELEAILTVLFESLKELPSVLREILEVLYDKELARKAAESFVAFYKELVDQGFDKELALEMAKEYYEDNLSISKILKQISGVKVERGVEKRV